MKEAEKRARLLVSYGGLVVLLRDSKKNPDLLLPRANLFAINPDINKDPAVIKAVKTKSWQRDYVQRLLDAEILEKIVTAGQEFYRATDLDVIDEILKDHEDDGLRLSRFLFPREAGIPAELLDDPDEPEEQAVQLVVPQEPMAAQVTDTLLSMLAEMLVTHTKEIDLLETLHARVSKVEADIASIPEALADALGPYISEVQKQNSESERTKLASLIGSAVLKGLEVTTPMRRALAEFRSKLKDLDAVGDLAMKVIEEADNGATDGNS